MGQTMSVYVLSDMPDVWVTVSLFSFYHYIRLLLAWTVFADVSSVFYLPKFGTSIRRNFLPSFGLRFPQFLTQVFPSILDFFREAKNGGSFVKGIDCLVKNRGKSNVKSVGWKMGGSKKWEI